MQINLSSELLYRMKKVLKDEKKVDEMCGVRTQMMLILKEIVALCEESVFNREETQKNL